jgi:hypothetical protein
VRLGRRNDGNPAPADELKLIRRELPRAENDLAAIEERVAQHQRREAELVERGVDSYLDGVDEGQAERERAAFDAEKVSELREQERLRLVVERLRARGADVAEEAVLVKERAADAQREDLRLAHTGALANVRRLEALIADNEACRFEFERERSDARAEFTGRKRDFQAEDDREVRRWVDLFARGLDRQELVDPPAHLRQRISKEIAEHKSRSREVAHRAAVASALDVTLPSGAPAYSRMPSPGEPPQRLSS